MRMTTLEAFEWEQVQSSPRMIQGSDSENDLRNVIKAAKPSNSLIRSEALSDCSDFSEIFNSAIMASDGGSDDFDGLESVKESGEPPNPFGRIVNARRLVFSSSESLSSAESSPPQVSDLALTPLPRAHHRLYAAPYLQSPHGDYGRARAPPQRSKSVKAPASTGVHSPGRFYAEAPARYI